MKTNEYLGVTEIPETPKVETAGNKFREIVRSVLIGRKNPDPAAVLKKPIPNNTNTLVTGTPVVSRNFSFFILGKRFCYTRDKVSIFLISCFMPPRKRMLF